MSSLLLFASWRCMVKISRNRLADKQRWAVKTADFHLPETSDTVAHRIKRRINSFWNVAIESEWKQQILCQRGAEWKLKDVQKASLFHFINFYLVNVSSNLPIKTPTSESDDVRRAGKIVFSQVWLMTTSYLLNQSAASGLLTTKLQTLLVWARIGRVVAMPSLKPGSAHLCKCVLTGGNREGWRNCCTRKNMLILHCENCG